MQKYLELVVYPDQPHTWGLEVSLESGTGTSIRAPLLQ